MFSLCVLLLISAAIAHEIEDRRVIHLTSDTIDTRTRAPISVTAAPTSLWQRAMSVLTVATDPDIERPTYEDAEPDALRFLHLQRELSAVERAELERQLGVSLDRYVPFNTYIVHLQGRYVRAAASHPLVAWLGAVEPIHKVHGSLLEHVWQMTVSRTEACKWNVVLLSSAHTAAVRTLVSDLGVAGVSVVDELDDGRRIIVDVPELDVREARRLLSALVESERVYSVERRLRYGHKNKYATWLAQSGVKNKRTVWEHGIRGEGQIVGVADSGLDYDHCFFNDPKQPAFSQSRQTLPDHRKVVAYFAFAGADYSDDVGGHGTHVCGSVAGKAMSSNAAEERVIGESNGAAPEAKLVFHDIGVTKGGLTVDSDVMGETILEPAYKLGARIHTNSWGCSGNIDVCNKYDGGARSVDDFVWRNKDMLVLFAAGNDGKNAAAMTQTVGSPATAKSALVVGAAQSTYESFEEALSYFDWKERKNEAEAALKQSNLDCCNPPSTSNQRAIRKYCCAEEAKNALIEEREHLGENSVADFSSRGPTYDGRIKPDLLAPGQNIVSAHADGEAGAGGVEHCGLQAPELNNNAARLTMQGTSMATPHAAGNAALVRQYLVEGWYPSGTKKPADALKPSGAVIKALMIASTVELTGTIDKGNNGTFTRVDPVWPKFSIFQGFGALRIANALKFADENKFDVFLDDVWPGAKTPGNGLESNSSTTYCLTPREGSKIRAVLVWDDYPAQPNAAIALVNNLDLLAGHGDTDKVSGNFKTLRDARNTAEHIIFEQPQTGKEFFVQVRSFGVPQGPQPYALVILGKFDAVKKGAECSNQDPFPTVQNEASEADYFPYGAVVGAGVGLGVAGMILMAIVRFILKNKGLA